MASGTSVIGQEIAGGDDAVALRRRVDAQRVLSGKDGGPAGGVDQSQLAVRDVRSGRDQDVAGLGGGCAPRHQVEPERPQRRIGDVLASRQSPTPALAWAQRAATAGDDDEMARPNMPVAGQRAAIEKVMLRSRG